MSRIAKTVFLFSEVIAALSGCLVAISIAFLQLSPATNFAWVSGGIIEAICLLAFICMQSDNTNQKPPCLAVHVAILAGLTSAAIALAFLICVAHFDLPTAVRYGYFGLLFGAACVLSSPGFDLIGDVVEGVKGYSEPSSKHPKPIDNYIGPYCGLCAVGVALVVSNWIFFARVFSTTHTYVEAFLLR